MPENPQIDVSRAISSFGKTLDKGSVTEQLKSSLRKTLGEGLVESDLGRQLGSSLQKLLSDKPQAIWTGGGALLGGLTGFGMSRLAPRRARGLAALTGIAGGAALGGYAGYRTLDLVRRYITQEIRPFSYDINQAVKGATGFTPDELSTQLTGMSQEEFKRKFRANPFAATQQLVRHIGSSKEAKGTFAKLYTNIKGKAARSLRNQPSAESTERRERASGAWEKNPQIIARTELLGKMTGSWKDTQKDRFGPTTQSLHPSWGPGIIGADVIWQTPKVPPGHEGIESWMSFDGRGSSAGMKIKELLKKEPDVIERMKKGEAITFGTSDSKNLPAYRKLSPDPVYANHSGRLYTAPDGQMYFQIVDIWDIGLNALSPERRKDRLNRIKEGTLRQSANEYQSRMVRWFVDKLIMNKPVGIVSTFRVRQPRAAEVVSVFGQQARSLLAALGQEARKTSGPVDPKALQMWKNLVARTPPVLERVNEYSR